MSITWVDNVTPLNAANMNVLEQTPRKNQNSGYLGLDASGNAALPGNILSGGANLDFRSVGGDVYLTCANGATATMRDLQGNELRLHSDGSLTLNALSNPRLTFDGDTNLYRSAAGMLQTNGGLTIQGGVDPTLVIGYVGNRIWQVRNTGKIEWGPGSTDTVDTNLYRAAAGTLKS